MEDDKKKASGDKEDVWKSLINEVKEEQPKQPIEKAPAPKQGPETQDSIGNKTIDKSIEKPIENAKEEPKAEEGEPKEAEEKPKEAKPAKKVGKFTTIMLTRELKEKLHSAKDPHESYGDFIARLLEKQAS